MKSDRFSGKRRAGLCPLLYKSEIMQFLILHLTARTQLLCLRCRLPIAGVLRIGISMTLTSLPLINRQDNSSNGSYAAALPAIGGA